MYIISSYWWKRRNSGTKKRP